MNQIYISLPLIDGSNYDITYSDLQKLEEAYPAVNVKVELEEMLIWFQNNNRHLKNRDGIYQHISLWLRNRSGFLHNPDKKIALEIYEILKSNKVNRLTYKSIMNSLDEIMEINLHL